MKKTMMIMVMASMITSFAGCANAAANGKIEETEPTISVWEQAVKDRKEKYQLEMGEGYWLDPSDYTTTIQTYVCEGEHIRKEFDVNVGDDFVTVVNTRMYFAG